MKKLIASSFAAVVMVAGLVTVSGGNATAAYPNTVATVTKVKAPGVAAKGDVIRIVAVVLPRAAKGTVTIVVRKGGQALVRKTVAVGDAARFKARARGNYSLKAVFHPAANSVYKSSTGTKTLVVR